MGGGGEEREVVGVEEEEVEGEGEEAGRREAMQMLPRMPVRVLLAEGDDSTRQIIAALLRKCGYRVSVASDGVKAWDILKDKSYSIDLVLTEVELPLMSGFVLLSMIMEHEGCKNIPVIMMSSHDSVSMVFKCMLKGASDFLVKPLRKNELRNLWQHVWRKQIANGGADVKSAQHEENLAARLEQTAGVSKGEHLAEDVAPKVRECSEQESDAQSSCTRSELEAESKHINVVLEQNQPTGRQLSTTNHKNIHENKEAIVQTTKDNDLMPMREVDLAARRRSCSNENDSERAPRAPELAHVIDNQPKHNMQRGADVVKRTSQGNGDKCLSIPAHQLELSLRRSDYSSLENQDKYDRRVLNHSTSSAFSLYNCRTATPSNAADALPCTSAPDVDLENKGGDSTAAPQDKAAPSCTPIRVIPFPVPVGGITFDGQPYWNGAPMTSLFYPHSATPVWTSNTSMWQEATSQANQSEQNDPKDVDPKEVEDTEEQPVISPSNGVQKDMRIEIPLDEQRHVSPMTGESGSSSILDSTRNTLSSSGCDSCSNRITGTTKSGNAFKVTIESRNPEGLCRLSQREAALNKFRLKRKERCFEKKVRYQSRKLLAEQRPRVKGQFVRQDHNVQGS